MKEVKYLICPRCGCNGATYTAEFEEPMRTHVLRPWIKRLEGTMNLTTRGIVRIAKERNRQLLDKGYTLDGDDKYTFDELADAATVYASSPSMRRGLEIDTLYWPWDWASYKPTPEDRIKELEKAGALIAAEIDRLLRKQTKWQRK